MPSFNENPTEFADLNTAFPELNSQVGLSYQQVQAIGENEYYNKNQITQANTQLNSIKDGASIDSFGDVESALANKQDTIQYSTMPTASEDNVGAIVQYTGDTDSTYTNGYFYKCVESGGTYSWEEVISGGGGGGGDVPANMVTTNTVQTITSEKWLNGGWKIGTAPNDPTMRTMTDTGMINSSYGQSIEMLSTTNNNRRGVRYTWHGIICLNDWGTKLGGLECTTDTGNDGAFGVVKKTHANVPYMAFNFNQVIIALAGNTIITKMTAQEVFNGEIIYCLSNSTDNPISYKAGHFYRVRDIYDSSTQTYNITTVDVTFVLNNIVTLDTEQTITANKFFTEKMISGSGSDWFGQSGIGGAAGWSYGQTLANQDYMLYQLKEVVSTREPTDKIWGTHINKNDGHIYTAKTENGEDYWDDITPFKKEFYTNTTASTWVADSTYQDYGYKCVLSVSGVTANDYAEVIFGMAEATSGNYAPIAETGADTITIYSKVDDTITIPTIKVEKA